MDTPTPTEFTDCTVGTPPPIDTLLARHFALMRAGSPEESCHVMTSAELTSAGARLFCLRQGETYVAVGAFVDIGQGAIELKSMHVAEEQRGAGLGRLLLSQLLDEARRCGYTSAYLETGTAPSFTPARAMYAAAGFSPCPPFGDYIPDPLSVFMTRTL